MGNSGLEVGVLCSEEPGEWPVWEISGKSRLSVTPWTCSGREL